MGPPNLLFLVMAAAAPLLSVAKPLNYSMAKPPMLWINNNTQAGNLVTRLILIQDNFDYGRLNFAAGFVCATTPTCDMYLFAVFIIHFEADPVVVWSANQDHPVRDNATLEFTLGGNLVLRDTDGSHVWSSSNSGKPVAGMGIFEDGNLVLFDHSNATVWQSFDHPSDTLLLGQSLVEGMRLTSNTSATNEQFYITVLRDGLYAFVESIPPQCYFLDQRVEAGHYPTDYFLDQRVEAGHYPIEVAFINGSLTMLAPNTSSNITLPTAVSTTQYMRLESDGYLRLYDWSWSSYSWTMVYDILGSMNMDVCDYPTVCGEYGICTEGQCGCPLENDSSSSYFKLLDERKPNLGCTPITPISCQEMPHHRLLALPNISYFEDSHTTMNATSIDDCKQACLKNCSCMAVLFTGNYDPPDCVWLTKVFSLKSIQHRTDSYTYSSSAYLKVQLNPYNQKKKKVELGATLAAVTTLLSLVIVVALYLQRRRKNKEKDEFDFDQLPGNSTRYSFGKLSECTEGFSKKLGEGGFGSVFEGKLSEERVAVKRLEGARQGKKEFLAEVETIGSIEHINLVRLIGFCVEKYERLLVYEYMSRGSLDRWIYNFHNNGPLDWCTRFRIILDVAKGLCYLHEECRRKIVHLDIKPQNILLDDNFNAKMADFGLCKLIDRDQSKVVTMMRGTPGYLAPEWLTSRITEKVDVYSFGVVVMEIVSGRKNVDHSQPEEDVHLINLLQEKVRKNQLIDLIDKHSDDMVSHQEQVAQMMKLPIWCLQHDSIQRPSMSTVIKVLEGAISVETFDANSLMFIQDNPSAYSVLPQASILSGPR